MSVATMFRNLPDERWAKIPGYPGYEVSNCGRIRSFKDCGGNVTSVPHLLRTHDDGKCPKRVTISLSGQRKTITVGHEVMRAFGPPAPTAGHVLKYVDGNCRNARVENLAWAKPARHRLTEEQVVEMRRRYKTAAEPHEAIAKRYGVSLATVGDVLNYRTWSHVKP